MAKKIVGMLLAGAALGIGLCLAHVTATSQADPTVGLYPLEFVALKAAPYAIMATPIFVVAVAGSAFHKVLFGVGAFLLFLAIDALVMASQWNLRDPQSPIGLFLVWPAIQTVAAVMWLIIFVIIVAPARPGGKNGGKGEAGVTE